MAFQRISPFEKRPHAAKIMIGSLSPGLETASVGVMLVHMVGMCIDITHIFFDRVVCNTLCFVTHYTKYKVCN